MASEACSGSEKQVENVAPPAPPEQPVKPRGMGALISDMDIEAPRGFPSYGKMCCDERFTPEIRGQVENLCRRILNRRKKLSTEKAGDEETWFKSKVQGDKGPLHQIAQHVRSKNIGKGKSFTLILGASANKSEAFTVSPSTWDFPWFSIVMNELCRESPGPFNAWELSFSDGGHIGAKALSDELVTKLPQEMQDKLKRLGFRLTADQVLEPLNLTELCSHQSRTSKGGGGSGISKRVNSSMLGASKTVSGVKRDRPPSKEEVEEQCYVRAGLARAENLLSAELQEQEECVINSVKRIRALARRVRLQGGLINQDRGLRVNKRLDELEEKFQECYARVCPKIDKLHASAASQRKTTTSSTDDKVNETREAEPDKEGDEDPNRKKTDDLKEDENEPKKEGIEEAPTLPFDFDKERLLLNPGTPGSDSIELSPRSGIDDRMSDGPSDDDHDEPAGNKGFKIFQLTSSPDVETSDGAGTDNEKKKLKR